MKHARFVDLNSFKVALISLEFPPVSLRFGGGGISTVCYGLANSISKKGIPATVFSGTYGKPKVEKLSEFLDVIRLPCFNLPPSPVWFQLRNFHIISKLLKSYTVLHGVYPQSSAIYAYYKKRLKKPFVTTIHAVPLSELRILINSPISHWTFRDFGYHILEYPIQDFLIRSCLAYSDHIVACSFATLNELRKAYNNLVMNNVSVICNGINFDEIDNAKIDYENATSQGSFSIVFAGRLFWVKGVMFLLRAFEIVRRDFADLDLKIFGKGPLEQRIKKFVSHAGLKDRVHVRGYVPHEDLITEVKKADIVVVPSIIEAQPMFMLEAMACKKPVIAFDLPFAREIIVDMHNGLLAKVYDVKDLSNKIQLLLSDKKLRFELGRNAYKHVRRKHDWDLQAEKYLEIYQNVANS